MALFHFTRLPPPRRVAVAEYPDGRRLWARTSDHTQRKILFDCFEPRETGLVWRILRPGDTFVDVGAHVGWFTVAAGLAVGAGGKVLAFEAFPANAQLLRRNVAENRLGHASVVHAAVTDTPGFLDVGIQPGSDSGSVTAGPGAGDVVRVPAVRLDDVVPTGPVQLIKIDVEGFEARVLAGGVRTLSATRYVLIELNRSALERNGSSPEAIDASLDAMGFVHRRVVERSGDDEPHAVLPGFCNLIAGRVPLP